LTVSQDAFTPLPVERFSHSAALQYYQSLDGIDALVTYIQQKLCTSRESYCLDRVEALRSASSIDIDFDAISHALTLNALWAPRTWTDLTLTNKGVNDRVEVGILSSEKAIDPEELSMGGFLTVIGEDSKPSATLFSFPARHHIQDASYTSTFLHPTGLHPTMQLQISSATPPTEDKTCSIHAHLTLPRSIFADKYQLSDSLFMSSKNLSAVRHITPNVDLEAPEYTQKIWGSAILLELSPPSDSTLAWTAEVPLHLRYLRPSSGTAGLTNISLPYPVLFWACTADEGSKFPINPFDRVNLGYDGLFGPKTMFYHLSPESEDGVLNMGITVPVLDLDKSAWVESVTALVIALGFAWITWCAWKVWKGAGYEQLKEKKKQ
jgi:hypothetical protein